MAQANAIETNAVRPNLLADIGLLSVALIWGLNMSVMKFALARVDAYVFNATRLLISAIVLALIVYWQKSGITDRSPDAKPVWYQWVMICVFAMFSGFAYQLLFLIGIDNTSAGNTALIMSAIPMWTAILAFIMLKEKIRPLAWIGLLFALLGTMVVTLAVVPVSASGSSLKGNLIIAAAALMWALGTVVSRPIMKSVAPLPLAFCGVAIAVPFHFLIAADSLSEIRCFFQDPWLAIALLYSGALSTGVAYYLWNYGIKVLGAAHTAIFQNLVPFFALFFAWLILGEIPVTLQIVGGGLIVAGVVIMRKQRD